MTKTRKKKITNPPTLNLPTFSKVDTKSSKNIRRLTEVKTSQDIPEGIWKAASKQNESAGFI